MVRSFEFLSRRPVPVILTGLVILITITLLLFPSGPFQRAEGWLKDHVTRQGVQEPDPSLPKFFEWKTKSEFSPVDPGDASNTSTAELCEAFPIHLLDTIQPVLKTGHAVLQERLPAQFRGVSACLDNVLIFSDLDEEYEGHEVMDAIKHIPAHLLQNARAAHELEPYRIQKELASGGELTSLDISELKGWSTDKFKFLTSIHRTWKLRPHKQWYIFYEDDTFVFWDNAFSLLSHFNPDEPWYFGSPSPGCHPNDHTHVWFAYGGAGYILSRAAMRKLVEDDWNLRSGEYLGLKLQERFWHQTLGNCCGDSILGCVLWHKGVNLSGLWPMFNNWHPHTMPFSAKMWCQPALTMHKPKAEDLEGLWRWEWQYRNLTCPILWRDVAISYWKLGDLTIRDNWKNTAKGSFIADKESKFYSHDPHESVEACWRACEALPRCLQWTFQRRKCHLDNHLRYGEYKEPEVVQGENEAEWTDDDLMYKAGWVQEKVRHWIDDRPCEQVKWLRPSIDRRY